MMAAANQSTPNKPTTPKGHPMMDIKHNSRVTQNHWFTELLFFIYTPSGGKKIAKITSTISIASEEGEGLLLIVLFSISILYDGFLCTSFFPSFLSFLSLFVVFCGVLWWAPINHYPRFERDRSFYYKIKIKRDDKQWFTIVIYNIVILLYCCVAV